MGSPEELKGKEAALGPEAKPRLSSQSPTDTEGELLSCSGRASGISPENGCMVLTSQDDGDAKVGQERAGDLKTRMGRCGYWPGPPQRLP